MSALWDFLRIFLFLGGGAAVGTFLLWRFIGFMRRNEKDGLWHGKKRDDATDGRQDS
jgi:hypothetical protein